MRLIKKDIGKMKDEFDNEIDKISLSCFDNKRCVK